MKRREELSFFEKIYVVEVARGLRVTIGKLLRNFGLHILHSFGLRKNLSASAAIQYPNERRPYPQDIVVGTD